MKKSIEDIKKIRELTEYEFSIPACKEAYENCGKDIDKAVEFLKASDQPIEVTTMTDEERSEFEEYKKKYEKRANRKAKWSKRLFESKACYIFSALFFTIAVTATITSIVQHSSNGVVPIIVAFALSILTLITAISVENMTDEEYKKASKASVPYAYNDGLHEVCCPECGGTHIIYKTKGFSKSKALLGVAITGRSYGVIFGVPSNKNVKAYCKDCGKRFAVINKQI